MRGDSSGGGSAATLLGGSRRGLDAHVPMPPGWRLQNLAVHVTSRNFRFAFLANSTAHCSENMEVDTLAHSETMLLVFVSALVADSIYSRLRSTAGNLNTLLIPSVWAN